MTDMTDMTDVMEETQAMASHQWRKLGEISAGFWASRTSKLVPDEYASDASHSVNLETEVPEQGQVETSAPEVAEAGAVFSDGFAEGESHTRTELAAQFSSVGRLVEELAAAQQAYRLASAQMLEDAIALLPELFRITLQHELGCDAHMLSNIAARLVESLPDPALGNAPEPVLSMNQTDYESLDEASLERVVVHVDVDPELRSGAFRIASPTNIVELDVPAKLGVLLRRKLSADLNQDAPA